MKIFVLGSTGMLGNYMFSYLNKYHNDVVGVSRKELDAKNVCDKYLLSSGFSKGDVVINCIGLIRQRAETPNLDFLLVNSVFPLRLSKVCNEVGCRLIHITTDCVFSGNVGSYDENAPHDAKDIYGVSKSLGEPTDSTVIRTSIIGEERANFLSLLEWVRSQKGKKVNGFVNHYWNGVTCLQLAKIVEKIIAEDLFWSGVRHVCSPDVVSKYELVEIISDVYSLGIELVPFETEKSCDRSLTTIHNGINFGIPLIREQVEELKNFKF